MKKVPDDKISEVDRKKYKFRIEILTDLLVALTARSPLSAEEILHIIATIIQKDQEKIEKHNTENDV